MSSEQIIIKKSKVKKSKVILIIEEDFDITKLKELPEALVNYCFSFLSTPETPEWLSRNSPSTQIKIEFDNVNWAWVTKYNTNPRMTKEKIKEWDTNRPSLWWDDLVIHEQQRMWNEKYIPVLTERFNKMPTAKLRNLTDGINGLRFQGKGQKNESKKSWMKNQLEMTPTSEISRKWCLWLIFLSQGLTPTNKYLFKVY